MYMLKCPGMINQLIEISDFHRSTFVKSLSEFHWHFKSPQNFNTIKLRALLIMSLTEYNHNYNNNKLPI